MAGHRSSTYKIFCLVSGEDSLTSFAVNIAKTETVSDLKDAIKEKKANTLANVDANNLNLYLVDVSADTELFKNVNERISSGTPPAPLNPMHKLSAVFEGTPAEDKLHIIVQPSNKVSGSDTDSRGRKRKRRDEIADEQESVTTQEAASALHVKAWGKPWPQSKGTISKTEISGDESGSVDEDDYHGLVDKLEVPPNFDYWYFEGIQDLKRALGAGRDQDFKDFLVFREEYEMLRQALEDDIKNYRSTVVTGHPGTGKTTFLFYLLLYRLERKLPTAIQLVKEYYFIFDEKGAIIRSFSDLDPRLEECWALTDSNDEVTQPCPAFKSKAKLVILVSSPKPEKWKEWIKQAGGSRIVSDLPSVPEIAAIAKELRKRQLELGKPPLYDPSSTLSLVRKWGPSTRNILRSMECAALGEVDPIEREAKGAVARLCNNLSAIFPGDIDLLGQCEVIFLRRGLKGSATEHTGGRFIPTLYLRDLFWNHYYKMANKESLHWVHTL